MAAPWPEGVDRVVLPETDSTSAELVRRRPARPTWLLAHHQLAARGRRGRVWAMPLGNFAASLSYVLADDPSRIALRSFVASLALHDALTELGVADLTLKWPNDVLLGDRKLAGILLECPVPGCLVVGIGLNLAVAPDAAVLESGAVPPIALAERGHDVRPEVLLDALAPAYAAREAAFRAEGFAPIREAWLARAARSGQRITARTMTETRIGMFEDVDMEGHLILAEGSGRHRIAAADIFFAEAPCS
ncbi:biotin--[acetyl-CoA-carboxylase] ligase [uncultured Jannaschia sp.]|uniref:biotin--[acetyl-CoA-carboxylase] ligase n=1 Tax=uncultured Jannaschia sp. TaxID=293347 RepID=UPI00261DC307|nr:biotin--[acetyl-CoA-carboxylase] ligase [uncultured Jannaschia sp.]